MRTRLVIVGIVLVCAGTVLGVFIGAAFLWGWAGLAVCTAGAALSILGYVQLVRPWHARWGATDEEVERMMPGDEIIYGASSTTRAISIGATPELVWPWLVQIGYGKAGWYSYDWIDNDGEPSADRIVPEFQDLKPGDLIQMLPGFGPDVIEVVPDGHLLAGDREGGSWCLALYPEPGGSRLVSRWRQKWTAEGIASRFFITLSDPGAFIMEQRMLRGIKERAELGSVPQAASGDQLRVDTHEA